MDAVAVIYGLVVGLPVLGEDLAPVAAEVPQSEVRARLAMVGGGDGGPREDAPAGPGAPRTPA